MAGHWPRTKAIDRPTRLLLALVRAGEELEAATSALAELTAAETQELLRQLDQQRLAPWVGYQLEQAGSGERVPAALWQELQAAMARAKRRALRQRLALLHTVRCLGRHGITAVALKGAQLAWQHYPKAWLRPMRDLDLLLPEEQIGRAFALLEAEGFQGKGRSVRRPDDPLMWRVNDFSLWHPSGAFIELHRTLWFRPGDILCGDFSLEPHFWNQENTYRQPVDHEGIVYLQPTYLALHCLVHHLLRQNLNMGPLGLVDLQLLQGAGHLQAPDLAEAAERLGFSGLLSTAQEILEGWRHTRWLTEAQVPSWVLPLLMGSEQNMLLYLDDRSIRSHARQWLTIQARGGRWSGPPPSRRQRLTNLARAVALLPRMASKPGVMEQLRRRLGKGARIPAEHQLPPELVLATHALQERSRAKTQPNGGASSAWPTTPCPTPMTSTTTFHRAFGLGWESRGLTIQELPHASAAAPADVRIEEEDSRGWPELAAGPHDTAFLQMGRGDLRLTVEDIGRFRISGGRRIGWERQQGEVSDQDLRTFLLGSAVGALLIQRSMLVLHGNALEKDGRAIVCLGPSGAGKSTLAYGLMQQGWRLLADDLVAITPDGLVLPGIPRIKLWHDAARAFGLDPAALPPIRQGMAKYLLLGEAVQRAPQAVPLQALYLIQQRRHGTPEDEAGLILRVKRQQQAALRLRNQAFRPRFVRGLGQEGANFLALARLQQRVPLAILPLPAGIPAMQTWLEQQDLLQAAAVAP